jgi:tetratricopeptide (TPR) repeat protein
MIPQPQDAEPSFTQARDQQTAQRSAADGDPNASTQAGAPSTSIPAALPLAASQRYALGDEIARGGMGVIYRATDMALGRDVAVKMLQAKFALDSGVARRFAAEARITAQLQHPGIPPVHDCGRMPDGRPFLSMKLVKGRTLDLLLRERSDPSADRGRLLGVFEAVCQAVGYAHAHRVLHRDLKPANVMVGGFGEVQVMDWGVAKLLPDAPAPAMTEADPAETTAGTLIRGAGPRGSEEGQTQAGSVLGTLAYMPPEQAAGEVAKVDQRADVFGLGAILAVILTGQPPYAGDAEAVRVMALRGELAACLARLDGCGAEPELVALCKRCLAFTPADRPSDAGAVAEAVARLRAAAEERARAAERERAAAEARAAEQRRRRGWQRAAGGTVVVALLAGVGGLAAYLRAQKLANTELLAANAREHERFELALDAVRMFHTGVSEDVLLKEEQFKGLRERLLRQAADFYRKLQGVLKGQPDAPSQRALARAYFLLAELTGKIGSDDEALAVHRQALALRRELAARGEPGAGLDVARSLVAMAGHLESSGAFAEAGAPAEEARGLAEAAGSSDDALAVLAESYSLLGTASWRAVDNKRHLHHREQELALRQRLVDTDPAAPLRRQDLASAYLGVGLALKELGRAGESLQAHQRAIDIYEGEARANPADAVIQEQLAKAQNNKGNTLKGIGKFQEAAAEFAAAVQTGQRASDANPAVGSYKNNLAFFHKNLGDDLELLGKHEEALQQYRRAAALLQPLADAQPAVRAYQMNLAESHAASGNTLLALGRPAEALPEFEQASRLFRQWGDAHPVDRSRVALADVVRNRGITLANLGRPAEAVTAYRESIKLLAGVAKPRPGNVYDTACCHALLHAAAADKASGLSSADARAEADHAVATLRRAIAAGYRNAAHMRKDTDLDSLRKMPDFEKVLADLEKDLKASGK